jgi:uncharacterized repeat protein (TIGR01451 family)
MRSSQRSEKAGRAGRTRLTMISAIAAFSLILGQAFVAAAGTASDPRGRDAGTTSDTTVVSDSGRANVSTETGSASSSTRSSDSVSKTAPSAQTAGSLTVDLDQFANLPGQGWQNGDLNGNNSAYHEGDVVPFRLAIEGLSAGQHSIHINYDFTAGGNEAYDFLATWNDTENPDICGPGGGADGSSLCPNPQNADTEPFPSDLFAPGSPTQSGLTVAGAQTFAGVAQDLTMYGGTIDNITVPTHSGPVGNNSSGDVVVTFTTAGTAAFFAWGGHIAQSDYWKTTNGDPNGAGQVSGAPWHMRTQNLDGSGNKNQDRSIQPSAIVPLPSLTVDKIADSGTVQAGQPIGYTVTVSNTGNVAITNVSLTDDPLPSGPGIDWSLGALGGTDATGLNCAVNGSPPNESLSCTKNSLAAGKNFTVHVTSPTDAIACGTYDNTASATADGGLSASSSSVSIVVTGCAPDLTISKGTSTNGSVNAGDSFSYFITVSNVGTAPATGVVISDNLDDTLTVDSATYSINGGAAIDCGNSAVGAGNTITCPDSGSITLGVSDSVVVTLNVTTGDQVCAPLFNTAHVNWAEDQSTKGLDSNLVRVDVTGCQPALQFSKNGPSSVAQGATVTYHVLVSNSGNADSDAVTVKDTVPLSSVSASFSLNGGGAQSCTVAGNSVTCNLGVLHAGDSVDIAIVGTAPNDNTCPTLHNTASIFVGQSNSGTSTNTVDTTVTGCTSPPPPPPPGSIVIVKGGPSVAHVGDSITYTFDVSLGAGSQPLTNITVVDPICNSAPVLRSKTGGDLDGTLESGETWNYTCTHVVTATDPDPLPNTATASGTTSSGTTVSDQDSHVVDLIHPAIDIVKSAKPQTGSPGDTIVYTYEVTNVGDVDLVNISVDDNVIGHICDIPLLHPADSVTCTASFVIPANANIKIDNIGEAVGQDELGVPVRDEDTARITVVLGVTITPNPPGGVAFTGTAAVVPLTGVALLLFLVGSGLLWAGRKRGDNVAGTEQ